MQIKKDFIGMFDVLKGICILLVITLHNLDFTNVVFPGSGLLEYSQRFLDADVTIMALFFIFIGYGFRPAKDMRKFVKKQAKQYLLPYAAVVILVAISFSLIEIIKGDFSLGVASAPLLGGVFGTISAIHLFNKVWIDCVRALWFLLALFFGSIIYNFIWQIKNEKLSMALIWILTALAIAVPGSVVKLCPWVLVQSCATLGFMEVGRLLKKHKLLYKKSNAIFLIVALALWIFVHMYSYTSMMKNEYRFLWLDYIEAAMAAVVILKAYLSSSISISDALAPLGYVGRYSIWFYCVHSFEYWVFPWNESIAMLFPAGISPICVFLVAEAVRIAFAVLVCLCINYIYGKILLGRLQKE